MTDHYEVLGLEPGASHADIVAAFNSLLAERKAKRKASDDLHSARAVLGDPLLRRAYDMARTGSSIVLGTAAVRDQVRARSAAVVDAIPDIDVAATATEAWQVALKTTVIVSGLAARAADFTSAVSRQVQRAAASRLQSAYPIEVEQD